MVSFSLLPLEPYPVQSAYPCNHAIVAYEPSDLNPTVAVILHLNPPPHQQYSVWILAKHPLDDIESLNRNPRYRCSTWSDSSSSNPVERSHRRRPTRLRRHHGLGDRRRHARAERGRSASAAAAGLIDDLQSPGSKKRHLLIWKLFFSPGPIAQAQRCWNRQA